MSIIVDNRQNAENSKIRNYSNEKIQKYVLKSNVKVEILLSTYNGEKYLKEQLDSLIAQDGFEYIGISVRDDGSTDGTCSILRDYADKYNLHVTYGSNIGVNASMTELLKAADDNAKYFAFCDQDDVWDKRKISTAIQALETLPENTPFLWGCMEMLSDENLNPISLMPVPRYLGNFYSAIIQNKLAGHTQVFNRALRDILLTLPSEKMYLYDWVNYVLASAFGTVIFEKGCYGLYRQHGDNVVGYELNAFTQIARRFKRVRIGALERITAQILCIYVLFRDKLDFNQSNELYHFLYSQRSIVQRFLYICKTKIKRDTRFETLQFRILYFLGAYGSNNQFPGSYKHIYSKPRQDGDFIKV